ncbi:hypothetical protein CGRA01v4_00085 [Colletotrichum graminicola]|nr:hypothetical protein CGRA01v4_00085 [Colletotrichum graminicola]
MGSIPLPGKGVSLWVRMQPSLPSRSVLPRQMTTLGFRHVWFRVRSYCFHRGQMSISNKLRQSTKRLGVHCRRRTRSKYRSDKEGP